VFLYQFSHFHEQPLQPKFSYRFEEFHNRFNDIFGHAEKNVANGNDAHSDWFRHLQVGLGGFVAASTFLNVDLGIYEK